VKDQEIWAKEQRLTLGSATIPQMKELHFLKTKREEEGLLGEPNLIRWLCPKCNKEVKFMTDGCCQSCRWQQFSDLHLKALIAVRRIGNAAAFIAMLSDIPLRGDPRG
jgi:hypothetical protein